MTNKIDEIDKAEALLTEASNSAADSVESAALATQAIGLLLLYFAKDQRYATQKLESVMQEKLESRLQEYNYYLKMLGLHEHLGGK